MATTAVVVTSSLDDTEDSMDVDVDSETPDSTDDVKVELALKKEVDPTIDDDVVTRFVKSLDDVDEGDDDADDDGVDDGVGDDGDVDPPEELVAKFVGQVHRCPVAHGQAS